MAWTPDQRYLLFVTVEKDHPCRLWRVSAAGGTPQETGLSVQGVLNSIRVDPDGRRLSYANYDNGVGEVWALENFLPRAAAKK